MPGATTTGDGGKKLSGKHVSSSELWEVREECQLQELWNFLNYYESIKRELKIKPIYECRVDVMKDYKLKLLEFESCLLLIKKMRGKDRTYI
jgi:hypothetical protein